MKLAVRAPGLLEEGEVTIELEQNSTVRDAIKLVSQRYRNEIENFLLTRTGEIEDEVFVSNNGVVIRKADTPLREGELVLILPYLGAG